MSVLSCVLEDGTNYENEGTVSKYRVQITENICYGMARGFWSRLPGYENNPFALFTEGYLNSFKEKPLLLNLDLYEPVGIEAKKPLILFIHGGSFYAGDKAELAYCNWGNYFASRGFVVASINYRLGYRLNTTGYRAAAYRAYSDARKALQFLVENADNYGIDAQKVFLAGTSAGSITALSIAFSGEEEENDECQYKILAVANMWGSVEDLSILENNRVSIISFHGDDDKIVPYNEGHPFEGYSVAKMIDSFDDIWMYGSAAIHREAQRLGLRNKLHTFHGEGHSLNVDKGVYPNKNHTIICREIRQFFEQEVKAR